MNNLFETVKIFKMIYARSLELTFEKIILIHVCGYVCMYKCVFSLLKYHDSFDKGTTYS